MSESYVIAADHVLPVATTEVGAGWMAVEQGVIIELGTGEIPEDRGPVRRFSNAALIPAFVNAHTHLGCHFLKDLDRDQNFAGWLTSGVAPRVIEAARGVGETLRKAAAVALQELVSGGFGTIADGFFHEAGLQAMKAAGVRWRFFREYFGSMNDDLNAYAAEAEAHIEDDARKLAGHNLISAGVAPHALYTCPPQVLTAVVAAARKMDIPISMHVAESLEESQLVSERRGLLFDSFATGDRAKRYPKARSPVAYLDELGLFGPDFLAVHAVQLDAADIEILARAGAKVVHCPTSNAMLGVGIARTAELSAAGVPWALGTDSGGSAGKLDAFEEMRFSILLARVRDPGSKLKSSSSLDRSSAQSQAAEALHRATLSGAELLGLGEQSGSLEPGKAADFAVVSLADSRHRFARSATETLVWAGTPTDVLSTWVGGRCIFERNPR